MSTNVYLIHQKDIPSVFVAERIRAALGVQETKEITGGSLSAQGLETLRFAHGIWNDEIADVLTGSGDLHIAQVRTTTSTTGQRDLQKGSQNGDGSGMPPQGRRVHTYTGGTKVTAEVLLNTLGVSNNTNDVEGTAELHKWAWDESCGGVYEGLAAATQTAPGMWRRVLTSNVVVLDTGQRARGGVIKVEATFCDLPFDLEEVGVAVSGARCDNLANTSGGFGLEGTVVVPAGKRVVVTIRVPAPTITPTLSGVTVETVPEDGRRVAVMAKQAHGVLGALVSSVWR